MMQVYSLYRGKLTPDEVLATAKAGDPSEETLHQRLFYAHLYLGLFHEVRGDLAAAKKHIAEAEKRKINHYMWDVAAVHKRVLDKPPEKKADTKPTQKKEPEKKSPDKKPAEKKPAEKK
jgi:lipoprotein NlpI